MTLNAENPRTERRPVPLSRRQTVVDLVVAGVLLVVVLAVHVSRIEAVAQNRATDVLSVALTVVAVGPLALRRRYPLPVLAVTMAALLALITTRSAVGEAFLGPVVAFYTAVAWGSRRSSRTAIAVVVAAFLYTALLRPVDLSAEGAVVSTLLFAGAGLLGAGARVRRHAFDADIVAAQQRAELAGERALVEHERAERIAVQERLRITRELHDVLGHALSVMVVQAGVAERFLDTSPDHARRAVEEIARTGRRSLTEMRQILGTLRDSNTGILDDQSGPGGPVATLDNIEALAQQVQKAGLAVTVRESGDPGTIPPGVELAAYRVIQEALTNCLRHSAASQAAVTITYHAEAVEIEIVDDGQPPTPGSDDAEPGASRTAHGIAGMRERVAIYGGTLSVGRRATAGFRVHALFPVPAATGLQR